jgi:hypothetical protein
MSEVVFISFLGGIRKASPSMLGVIQIPYEAMNGASLDTQYPNQHCSSLLRDSLSGMD